MFANPVRLVARLPRPVRLLILGTFVNRLGSFITPFLALVAQREFGLSPGQTGALVMAYGAGSLASILVGGQVTDRLGRRTALLLSLFGSGALAVGMAASPSLHAFVPMLVLFGLLVDLYRPASASIISDLLPSADRAVGFAAMRLAVNLGFAVGVAVGGVLADTNWRLLFAGDGLTTLLFGMLVWIAIGETRPGGGPAAAAGPGAAAPPSPWRDRVFCAALFASFSFCLVLCSFSTLLPLTVTQSAGYPAKVYGLLLSANGLVVSLFEVPVAHAFTHGRRLRVAAIGLVLTGLGFGLSGMVRHWAWLLAMVVLWTFGEILTLPQYTAFVADWAPPEARGRYMSLSQATFSLAFALNPVITLPLRARFGEAVIWPLHLVVVLPAVVVLVHLDRTADRPERLRGRQA
ncbi:MAG TPA: MFS transporter [Vicinamibacteria bacterium]